MTDAAHLDLPHRDSHEIKLVVATPEELLAQQHANSEEWRGPLSLDAYIRRELLLYDQDITRHGGLTPWQLVHEGPDGSTRRVLCGCETLRKRALKATNGRTEDVIAHGVASVFCPPAFRGKGYAGRMMTEVNRVLRDWQMEQGQPSAMSVLYSDIGKAFYSLRGWQPFASAHIALPAMTVPVPDSLALPATTKLSSDDLTALCRTDEDLMRTRVTRQSETGRTCVAIVPDRRTIDWHHARERFVAQELLGRSPSDAGAMVNGDIQGQRIWCYWTRVWTNPNEQEPNTLHILRLVVEDDASFEAALHPDLPQHEHLADVVIRGTAALLASAQTAAHEWGMKQVQIWNPCPATVAAARRLGFTDQVQHREQESIASLLWYGQEDWREVDWLFNEKYAWC